MVHLYLGYGDPQNEREALRLAARMLSLRWVRSWGLQLEPSSFAGDRSYRQVMARIYEEWARKENKPRWGDKTPLYVTKIPVLLEIFPSAKIIHIYRDGRDVALDWAGIRFGPHNLFTVARDWKAVVSAGRQAGAGLPQGSYLEVRYESLVSDSVETMKRVCAFLDEPFTDAVLRPAPYKSRSCPYPHRPIFGIYKPRIFSPEIMSTEAGKWKREMPRSDRILFESVAGDLLETLGYETERVTRPITKSERFMWRAHNFFLKFLSRLNTTGSPSLLQDSLVRKWAAFRYRRRVAVNGKDSRR